MKPNWLERGGRAPGAGAVRLALLLAIAGCHAAQAGMQMPPTQVTVVTVKPQTIAAHFRYQGIAQSSKHIIVRAQVAGVDHRAPVRRRHGRRRRARCSTRSIRRSTRAALRTASGNLDDAKAKLGHAQTSISIAREPLLAERAVAQSTVDSAEQILRQAQADVGAYEGAVDQARKSYNDCFVRAEVVGPRRSSRTWCSGHG